jgi:hypothetical protein
MDAMLVSVTVDKTLLDMALALAELVRALLIEIAANDHCDARSDCFGSRATSSPT